ncbi:MAG: HDIG domain-containing protein [Deltaproteobacteria bacterium]|nr:HDIG domain-containing protein [Deltaproteobacteria bacterium]
MAAPSKSKNARGSRVLAEAWRWLMPALVAAALIGNELLILHVFPADVPAKGSMAQHTYRAAVDAVFDLHESYVAEAREARQSYLPIYIQDPKLLHTRKEKIVAAALGVERWGWPPLQIPADSQMDGADGGVDGGGVDAGVAHHRDASEQDASEQDASEQDASEQDASEQDASEQDAGEQDAGEQDAGLGLSDGGGLPWQVQAARRRDLQALLYGSFRFLERYYEVGVIPDAEFPNEKKNIRVYVYGRYKKREVKGLYRFSNLRGALKRALSRFFYRVPSLVRRQAIDFILQRLPANLRYAKENRKFIADISQVTGIKVIRIRRGDVLVARGRVVDTRAHHAIVASIRGEGGHRAGRLTGRFILSLALLFLFVIAGREMEPRVFGAQEKGVPVVMAGMVLILGAGHWALYWWPVHITTIPQAAITLVVAVVYGRRAGVTAAVIVATGFGITTHFDLAAILVGASGGVIGALTVRHRRRGGVLPAGILVGLAQALAFEATRAAAGRVQTYQELWGAAQAFAGGVLAGVVAFVLLPFVQRWLGVVSRGELRVLADYEHPLLSRLREDEPEVFSHSLRVMTLADHAAKGVGADRLLARVGALYHDVGCLETADEVEDAPLVDRARHRLQRVVQGCALLRREGIAAEVVAVAEEHLGTLEMVDLVKLARAGDEMVDRAALRYGGPRPHSLEAVIVMMANEVDRRATAGDDLEGLPKRVVVDLLAQFQFAECRITQRQVRAVEQAMAEYHDPGKEPGKDPPVG